MAGVASTLIEVLLVIIATIPAIVGQVGWPGEKAKAATQRGSLNERDQVFDLRR